jgi:hypothetical protein
MANEDTDVFDEVEEETEQEETETETDVNEETETKVVEKESTEDASTSENESSKIAGLTKALQAERTKRQAAEAKVKQQETKPEVVPDPVTDPDGYNKYVMGKSDANSLKTKIELTQEIMRDSHEDYDEAEKTFISLIADEYGSITDQKLVDQFNASPNPAKFAYNHVKAHQKNLERNSDDYESKIRAEERTKLINEMKDSGLSATDLPDFTNATASGSNTESEEKEAGDVIDVFD